MEQNVIIVETNATIIEPEREGFREVSFYLDKEYFKRLPKLYFPKDLDELKEPVVHRLYKKAWVSNDLQDLQDAVYTALYYKKKKQKKGVGDLYVYKSQALSLKEIYHLIIK